MRAYRLSRAGSIDALVAVDLPSPVPGPRQVLIEIAACSLNYRDLAIVLGTYRGPIKPDLVPLSDGAGVVVAAGSEVTRVAVGDRVAGCFFQRWLAGSFSADTPAGALGGAVDGMLAQYVALDEDGVVKIPAHLTLAEAATLPCAAVTAWHALAEHACIRAGETVLVQGTGGVSIFALQLAHLMGARVIVTSSSDDKLTRAKTLGAWHGVNYERERDWEKAVLAATEGLGVDHVVEVGGPGTLARSLRAIRMGGRISLIGVLAGAAEINPMLIFARRANVQGVSVGSAEMFRAMNRAVAAGAVRPVIDSVFAFDQVRDALRHLQSARHFGKIVIAVK
ncbi:MAG: NAD(P)-dependent alcohol dehydrogenase [Hyphomicrobiales bacterium]|nr:NAD(P)-dependent alcohol dehydrogenase [Hyphomicrobiales bacterium]